MQWQGEYFNPPVQGTITGFTINLYAADGGGGAPGTVLDSEHFAGNSNETPDGMPAGFPAFLYSQNIAGFAAAAGTEYWMSIVPDLGFPPQWGWAAGSGGDGVAYQCFFGSCGFNIPEDLAFTLNGGNQPPPIPEPSSLPLLGTGLLAAVLAVRRNIQYYSFPALHTATDRWPFSRYSLFPHSGLPDSLLAVLPEQS